MQEDQVTDHWASGQNRTQTGPGPLASAPPGGSKECLFAITVGGHHRNGYRPLSNNACTLSNLNNKISLAFMKIPRANKHERRYFWRTWCFCVSPLQPGPFDAASSSPPPAVHCPFPGGKTAEICLAVNASSFSVVGIIFAAFYTTRANHFTDKRRRTQRKRFELISCVWIYRLRAIVVPEFMLSTRYANNRLPQTHFSIPYHRVDGS